MRLMSLLLLRNLILLAKKIGSWLRTFGLMCKYGDFIDLGKKEIKLREDQLLMLNTLNNQFN
jgi:hypothetical protein